MTQHSLASPLPDDDFEPAGVTDLAAAKAPGATVAEKGGALGGAALRGVVWLGAVRWAAQLFIWASTLVL
ncbi:MAG TPA: hypothetical protein VFZ21_10985, partial [Gemmatimonadaceae bacterium]|nr:hypothetical protein [Gemmatimonadaceae bacterium]